VPLRSELLFTMKGVPGTPVEVGTLSHGQRRIFPIAGGDFEGPRLRGKLLPIGTDSLMIRPDGVLEIDLRGALETDDGAAIYMHYRGMRHATPEVTERLNRGEVVDPAQYYFRVIPYFETGAERYAWLNRIVCVGVGRRTADGPVYEMYEIL
jgi:hypothetical protein